MYKTQKLRDYEQFLSKHGGIEGYYRERAACGNTRKEIAENIGMSVPALAKWITRWNKAKKEQER